MPRAPSNAIDAHNRYIAQASGIADSNATGNIYRAVIDPLLALAKRLGCTSVGSSGETPRGLPFRLRGRSEDLFSFRVELYGRGMPGVAAILFEASRIASWLRPQFLRVFRELQRTPGQPVVLRSQGRSFDAIGFDSPEAGLAIIQALDDLLGVQVERHGADAVFAPAARSGSQGKPAGPPAAPGKGEGHVDPKVWAFIQARRGQPKFRAALLQAYGQRCAITDCSATQALEAAHITPYADDQTFEVTAGLLLRADVHTLFDLHLISVDPRTHRVCVASDLMADYGEWDGIPLRLPEDTGLFPCEGRLREHHAIWAADWAGR